MNEYTKCEKTFSVMMATAAIAEKERANPDALARAIKVGVDRIELFGKIVKFSEKWDLKVYNIDD